MAKPVRPDAVTGLGDTWLRVFHVLCSATKDEESALPGPAPVLVSL